ncbi:IclR family transcriptional regulator [Burkholderia cenocepacia]|nr:IclR family transcriptional regulator [Burkholderia cenocepacia]
MLRARVAALSQSTCTVNDDFDFVAFTQPPLIDQTGRKAHGQTIPPLRNPHTTSLNRCRRLYICRYPADKDGGSTDFPLPDHSRDNRPLLREHRASPRAPPMTKKPDLDRRDWIAGLEKGLMILEAFDSQHARMTPTQAAARTGLTRTAARRYLLTLESLGYVYTDGKLYGLTPRVLRVGWSYFDSARLPRTVQPYLQQLSASLNESAYVSVLDGWELVFIARNGVSRVMTTGFVLGARVPAPLTSPGVVLLAHHPDREAVRAWLDETELPPFTPHTITNKARLLEQVDQARDAGYAAIEQQLQVGVRGIAVPLKNRHGEVVAALSTNMPIGAETTDAAVRRVLPHLQEAALAMLNVL